MPEVDNIILLIIAILNAVVAVLAWKTQQDMKAVKHATNSMKDALVKSTGEASFSAGQLQEREASDIRAKDLLADAAEPKAVEIIASIPLEIKEPSR